PAPRFSATPTSVRSGPALPGADTEAVAADWDLPGLPTTGKETTG
ncbi:CoA transferase, partial [Streptomyces sp. WI03-5b]|nr:CoA transferase [Streptomyces sp. WI03-5b]